jgi:hypothetical protein
MINIYDCQVDAIHAYSIEVFNPNPQSNNPIVTAKIGYHARSKPAGEVTVNDLGQIGDVAEAAKILIEAIEKAFAPKIGIIHESKPNLPISEPPPGLADF